MEKRKFHGIPDKANCTYWWRFYLDPTHPDNKATMKTMDGYSKFQNHDEAKNKEDILMAKCEMFYKYGYLKRSTHIEIFIKRAPLPSIEEDQLILTLYPNDYVISEFFLKTMNWRMQKFLKNYYDAIKGNRQPIGLRPLREKQPEQKDIFDISIYNFRTYGELYTQADKLLSLKHPPGMVQAFVEKYIRERFNNKTQQELVNLFLNSKKTA